MNAIYRSSINSKLYALLISNDLSRLAKRLVCLPKNISDLIVLFRPHDRVVYSND